MMLNDAAGAQESFVIPSRTLRGSKREMVQDIDHAIVGLLALRHLIDADGVPFPTLTRARRGSSALNRVRAWLGRLPAASGRRDQRGSPEGL